MSSSLYQLNTKVRRWIHELVPAESFYSDNLIHNLINQSYRRRVSQIVMAFEGSFVQVAQRNLVADQNVYAWPQNLVRLVRLDHQTTDGTLIPIPRDEKRYDIRNNTSNTEPFTFRPTGSGFFLHPTPKETVTNGLRIEYQITPQELTADGDTLHTDFPEMYSDIIVLDTVVYLLDTEGLLEDGAAKSVLRARDELEWDWERWINNKIVQAQNIVPFTGHYLDA